MSNLPNPCQDQCQHPVVTRLREWNRASASELRLRCGELSAQEIRTIRSVLRSILQE